MNKIFSNIILIGFIFTALISSPIYAYQKNSTLRPASQNCSSANLSFVETQTRRPDLVNDAIWSYLNSIQPWKHDEEIILGIPKEIKTLEYRVGINPQMIKEILTEADRAGLKVRILIQKGAGIESCYNDEDFISANKDLVDDDRIEICDTAEEVWSRSHIIKKVKEPQPEEYKLIKKGQVIFTYFHFASNKDLILGMKKSRATCIAYETVKLGNRFPMLEPMSEVAGREAAYVMADLLLKGTIAVEDIEEYIANYYTRVPKNMQNALKGKSILILGGGIVSDNAAIILLNMGAKVYISEINSKRIALLRGKSEFKRFVKSKNLVLINANRHKNVLGKAKIADGLIGGIYSKGKEAFKVFQQADMQEITDTRERSRLVPLRIVDVAIDQGGCIVFVDKSGCLLKKVPATTHVEPLIYDFYHNQRYHVANMPSLGRKRSTDKLSKATTLYLLALIKGFGNAVAEKPELLDGFSIVDGNLLDAEVYDKHKDVPLVTLFSSCIYKEETI